MVNQLSGKVLDNTASSLDNLSLVQQFDFLNSDSQKWQLVPVDNTYFEIVNKLSGKVLDVRDYSLLNGAPIQQFVYLGGENQKWRFIPVQ
jgi:glucosylceramidase